LVFFIHTELRCTVNHTSDNKYTQFIMELLHPGESNIAWPVTLTGWLLLCSK